MKLKIMSLPTQPYKGARDFYPEDKRQQKYMFNVMRQVVEGFGYQEYDAPILEPLELYLSKTSQEIVTEQTYNFTDRGKREVTLRPEMTPSVSRMVAARRQELAYPLRWYSLPNLWRYERPQRGRLREHWQLNVDLFGVSSLDGDHEVILVADSVMKSFGAKPSMYSIRLSSRLLVQSLLTEHCQLEQTQATALMRLVDRMDKLSEPEFLAQIEMLLRPSQREATLAPRLLELLSTKRLEDLPTEVFEHAASQKLSELVALLKSSGVSNVVFDLSLMRGFDYYSDIVFEVFDTNPENNRSMFGGGRYDGLVGLFGVEPLPTVGFGMGDVTLQNFLVTHKLMPTLPPETDATAILIGGVYKQAQKILADFRREGVRLAIDTSGRKLDKMIKSAAKGGTRFVIFIGTDELSSEQYRLKDLVTGKEETGSFERTVATIAANHKRNGSSPEEEL